MSRRKEWQRRKDGDRVKAVLTGVVTPKKNLTIRLPESVLDDLESMARERNLSLSATVEQTLTQRIVHPRRTRAAADARKYTAIGYRLSRAVEALDASDAIALRERLTDARRVVIAALTEIRDDYETELDALKDADNWFSVDQPFRGRGLPD